MISKPAKLNRIDAGTELFIDALRGFAALMVLATHAFDLAISKNYGWSFGENPPFWRFVRAVFGTGEHWVWCFFVISGFCIHLSIARGLRSGSFKVWPYTMARVTRIYPLYLAGFVFSLFTFAVVSQVGGFDMESPVRQFWATLLSLQIFTNPYPSYEVSWSLSCEMIFYAAWPALLLMSRLEVRRSFQFGMFCSLLTLALILVVWSQFHKLEDRAFVDGIWTLCALFPLWLCGAWLAEDWDALSAKISRRLWISGLLTFVAAMAFLFTLRYMQYPPWSVHMASWLALPGVFIGVAGARHLRMDTLSEKSQNLCRWLGLLSYPCYVLHLQLLHLADHYLSPLLPESWARQPLVLVGLYLVAALPPIAWAGPQIERAIMAWRGRMIKTARKPALPVAA